MGGEIFCTCLEWPWGPPSLLYNGYRFSYIGVKHLGHGIDHPAASGTRVEETVDPLSLLPIWGFMASSGVKFTFLPNHKTIN